MKKLLFCLGFFAMILVNQANAGEIAIINVEEIIKNSTAMTKVNKELEAKKSDIEKKLKIDEKKLSDEKTSLEAQIKTLSQDVAQQKVMDFQQKVMDFQKTIKENENDLQKAYMNAVVQITNTVKDIVAEMKNEKNSKYDFQVVLPSASVIYSDDNLDISSEVLSRLNKKLKEIKVVDKK